MRPKIKLDYVWFEAREREPKLTGIAANNHCGTESTERSTSEKSSLSSHERGHECEQAKGGISEQENHLAT